MFTLCFHLFNHANYCKTLAVMPSFFFIFNDLSYDASAYAKLDDF